MVIDPLLVVTGLVLTSTGPILKYSKSNPDTMGMNEVGNKKVNYNLVMDMNLDPKRSST